MVSPSRFLGFMACVGVACVEPPPKLDPETQTRDAPNLQAKEEPGASGGRWDPEIAPAEVAPSEPVVSPDLPGASAPGEHATVAGWSVNGSFGVCSSVRGLCTQCEIMDAAGKGEQIGDCNAALDGSDPAAGDVLQKRLADLALGDPHAKWIHGRELALLWDGVAGVPGEQTTLLRIGAQSAGSPVPVYSVRLPKEEHDHVHPDFFGLSPDGKRLGVVVHATGGAPDAFSLHVLDISLLAGKAYNGAGMMAHRSEQYMDAVRFFHAASYFLPAENDALYHLACGLAKAGEPGIEKALRLAVERGGNAVRERARKDADLDTVRGEAWFKAIISEG